MVATCFFARCARAANVTASSIRMAIHRSHSQRLHTHVNGFYYSPPLVPYLRLTDGARSHVLVRRIPLLLITGLSCALFAAAPAVATDVSIDPGAVGATFTDQTFTFSEVNGTPMNGQDLTVEFIFDDMLSGLTLITMERRYR